MNGLADVAAAAEALPPADFARLVAHLSRRMDEHVECSSEVNESEPRVAGLHAGQWQVSADFDAPLPDAFWLGKDA